MYGVNRQSQRVDNDRMRPTFFENISSASCFINYDLCLTVLFNVVTYKFWLIATAFPTVHLFSDIRLSWRKTLIYARIKFIKFVFVLHKYWLAGSNTVSSSLCLTYLTCVNGHFTYGNSRALKVFNDKWYLHWLVLSQSLQTWVTLTRKVPFPWLLLTLKKSSASTGRTLECLFPSKQFFCLIDDVVYHHFYHVHYFCAVVQVWAVMIKASDHFFWKNRSKS